MDNLRPARNHKLIAGFSTDEIEKNRNLIDRHYDPGYIKSIHHNIFSLLDRCYFRSRMIGFDELPLRNNIDAPLIYASNHSGMAFPWDGMVFGARLLELGGFAAEASTRALAAPILSQTEFMNPFFVPDFWKRCGGVDATMLNFETMMSHRRGNLLIFPEGVAGIGKGFNNRYRLQRFSSSFIRMAHKYQTDIIPYATVNGEYINPYSYRLEMLDGMVKKLGMPFMPVGPMLGLVSLFPWSFYMGLPARLTFVRGKAIRLHELVDKPFDRLNKKDIHYMRDYVQGQMQAELDAAVEQYGQDPYEWDELLEVWRANLDRLAFILPSGWPLLFAEHEARYHPGGQPVELETDNASFLRLLAAHPEIAGYMLPGLGWLFAGRLKDYWK